jgi:hypothetical protein
VIATSAVRFSWGDGVSVWLLRSRVAKEQSQAIVITAKVTGLDAFSAWHRPPEKLGVMWFEIQERKHTDNDRLQSIFATSR